MLKGVGFDNWERIKIRPEADGSVAAAATQSPHNTSAGHSLVDVDAKGS